MCPMEIRLARFTFATPEVPHPRRSECVPVTGIEVYATRIHREESGRVAVVPHDGRGRWDRPWPRT